MSETSTSESLPEWQANKDVQHLAEAILQEKRFQDLPILADALFDAGFSDEGALQSLRNPEYQDHFQYWTEFYQTYFKDINILDVLAVRFPERTKEQKELGFDLPIVIPKGLTLNMALKALKDEGAKQDPETNEPQPQFRVYSYIENLDQDVTENDRNPSDPDQGSYAVWMIDTQESNENPGNSAQELEGKIQGKTLLESLIYELWFFHKNKTKATRNQRHPNNRTWALATGSRCVGGGVPGVCWDYSDGRVRVYWFYSGDRNVVFRSRSVVSVPSVASEAQP